MSMGFFFIALAALAVSSFALFRPIRRIGRGSRRRALFASLIAAGSVGASAAMVGAEAEPTSASGQVAQPTGPSELTLANVKLAYDRAQEASEYCAGSFQAIAQGALQPGASAGSLYPLATTARDRCRDSSMAFNGMRPPEGVGGADREAFDAAFRTCALAYAGHQRAAEALVKAADNGLQPSLVARFRELGQEAATGKALCASQIAEATRGAGVEVPG